MAGSSTDFDSSDVLCFSHLPWDFVFQRPQHLMVRWARRRRVFYVEEPVRDSIGPRLEVRRCATGVLVVTPHLPASAPDDTTPVERDLLDGLMREYHIVDFIAWYYTPMALGWSRHVAARAVIYDCMDELSGFAGAHPQLRQREQELFEKADVVFTGGHLYQKFFQNYTRKQWGVDPSELDATVIARVPVRTNRDDRYFGDTYQAMPLDGFTALFERMLDRPNITVEVGVDYRALVGRVAYDEMVYTGAVDAYFDRCFGSLPYRSLQFRFETLDQRQHQPVAVVNYPNEHAYTRVTEFKHLTGQEHAQTALVYEYPQDEGDPYYPVPRPENAALHQKYQELAARTSRVHFVGRLATYRYSNMDQVVAQALTTACKLTGVKRAELLQQGA